jgi:aspartate aminotransferase-like enzyme
VRNLLYIVGLKVQAGEARVEAVAREGNTVVLTLPEPVGGARLALEKALGPLARVGNRQVRINIGRLGERWKEGLVTILERLSAFRERMQKLVT